MERFIISTGRSGSTLLSKMLRENTDLLSLSEFFGAVYIRGRLFDGPIDGAEFARCLCGADEVAVLARIIGKPTKDLHYDVGGDPKDLETWGVKYQPSLFAMAMPSLSDDPLKYFNDLLAFARKQPTRRFVDHCRALWAWMVETSGKSAWVERTGASLRWFPELRQEFPEARYVNLHRDGPEAALSLRNHSWGILAATFFETPPKLEELRKAISDPQAHGDLYRRFFKENLPPVEVFGRYWSYQIANGYKGFRHLRPDQLLDVRFEDLEQNPARELNRIAAFLELPNPPGWIDRAAALVTPGRAASRGPSLTEDEKRLLDQSCIPGQVLLGRMDPAIAWKPYDLIREAMG